MSAQSDIKAQYQELKRRATKDSADAAVSESILDLALTSLAFLKEEASRVDLVSRVPGKRYISYQLDGITARPANRGYFIEDPTMLAQQWRGWDSGRITDEALAKVSYTIALSPCLAMELFDRQNKKGPATYFEHMIGHIFSRTIGVNPQKTVTLPVHGKSVRLTMDFLYQLDGGRPNVHLPVKMSTRERVVQAWSHQRLLDAAYGDGAYRGIMVIFSETKMNSRNLEVVEICVPDQWLTYQTLLAKLDRIYYFDVPSRYQQLTETFPEVIQINQFGRFFKEAEAVLAN